MRSSKFFKEDGTTGSANHLPPYLDMIFASINSDGYGEADSIVIFTALPPLGWTRYSDLDDVYARGASSAGGSGDGSHSHSVTITTGGPQGLSSAGGGLVNTSSSDHTHSCATTSSSQTNEPPYMEVIYGQRKDPAPSASVGSEEAVSSGGGDGITYQYLYDGDGTMIAETIGLTTTVYIGGIYEKKDQDGTVTQKKYYMAGAIRVAVSTKVGAGSWDVNFLLSDHLGSTSLTVDADGDRVSEMRYSPWGSVRFADGVSPTDIGFNGQRSRSESFGLVYFKARWLDPALGRFISPDSIIPSLGNPISWDRYAAMMNNPLRYLDPNGHISCEELGTEKCDSEGNYVDDDLPLEDPNPDEDYLGEDEIKGELGEYGIELDGEWGYDQMRAVLYAVRMVGAALANRLDNLSSLEAFLEIFEKITMTWGLQGATGECAKINAGGCTSGPHQVNFESMSGQGTIQLYRTVKNVIHELGHVYDNLLDFGPRNNLPQNIVDNRYKILKPNQIEGRLDWQQNTSKTSVETWADMFIAWVYSAWNSDLVNAEKVTYAQAWIDEWLLVPQSIFNIYSGKKNLYLDQMRSGKNMYWNTIQTQKGE